jgi:hypothetical protein
VPGFKAWRTPMPGRLSSLALSAESAGTAGTSGALRTEPRVRREGKAQLDVSKLRLPPAGVLARLALPLVAVALGYLSLTWVRESAIGQYGLIQALPVVYFVAIALVAASFVATFSSARLRFGQFGVEITALVLLLEGAPAIAESEPRFAPAWLHAGFTDYVANTGQVLPTIDARYNWPSFFTGMAMLNRAAGLHTAIELLRWWPTAIDLLYLLPMMMLARTVLRDDKQAMLAVFLFPFANWVGQDYYSPQSVAYLLYLVLLCVVLKSFGAQRTSLLPRLRRRTASPAEPPADAPAKTADRVRPRSEIAVLMLVLLALCVAMDTGHQLTPFFAVAAVGLLVIVGRTSLLAWPGIMLLLAVGWVCYGAVAFWSGHFGALFGGLGHLGGNVSTDLRLRGNASHTTVDDIRLLMVGGLWLLGFAGYFAGRKTDADRRSAMVLMLVPVVVVTGQSYGGEAGLRAFLFSIPGAVCLVSLMLTQLRGRSRPWLVPAVVSGLIAVMIPGFVISRWGNELSEVVLPSEITGMNALFARAQAGSTLLAITPQVAWEYADIGKYYYAPNNLDEFAFGSVSGIVKHLAKPQVGGYVVITVSQLAYAQEAYGLPADWGTTVEKKLIRSGLFRLIYRNPTTKIYEYIRR